MADNDSWTDVAAKRDDDVIQSTADVQVTVLPVKHTDVIDPEIGGSRENMRSQSSGCQTRLSS